MKWIYPTPGVLAFLQIGLDICLIALLLWLIRGRQKDLEDGKLATARIGKIFEETLALAESFDSNLKERQAIISRLIEKLDQEIQQAKDIHRQLKDEFTHDPSLSPSRAVRSGEQLLIYQMAQQGLSPQVIAKRLKKPLGEIELILNLRNPNFRA